METAFDIIYLFTVIFLGFTMIRRSKGEKGLRLFGVMAVVLGCGDAFHLVPRAYALCTTGLQNHAAALGFGKFITSITMTVFYLILYYVWRQRYDVKGRRSLSVILWVLAVLRIGLCLMPQNQWLSPDAPLSWGIWRNIPFALIGLIMIALFYRQAKQDKVFRFMWLAITLSFAFYIPVVLFADAVPAVGMLMIPKTCAYVWIVWMGYSMQKEGKGRQI